MSPSTLRRYRAERLLRQEFGGLREEVLAGVRRRLRARGVRLDGGDLEACYAQAWQGLYTAVAAGEEVANPGGWLTVVTFRRAIDEHRSARSRERAMAVGAGANDPRAAAARGRAGKPPAGRAPAAWGAAAGAATGLATSEPDLAAALDDRARLRQLFEALRSRLSARECEAASLCYLQGLTRAQAAARMGVSEARMTKLMEGRGPGRPGVASKVGELLEAISGGEWCERQASLMRGLAFGILDPRGERYRLAPAPAGVPRVPRLRPLLARPRRGAPAVAAPVGAWLGSLPWPRSGGEGRRGRRLESGGGGEGRRGRQLESGGGGDLRRRRRGHGGDFQRRRRGDPLGVGRRGCGRGRRRLAAGGRLGGREAGDWLPARADSGLRRSHRGASPQVNSASAPRRARGAHSERLPRGCARRGDGIERARGIRLGALVPILGGGWDFQAGARRARRRSQARSGSEGSA